MPGVSLRERQTRRERALKWEYSIVFLLLKAGNHAAHRGHFGVFDFLTARDLNNRGFQIAALHAFGIERRIVNAPMIAQNALFIGHENLAGTGAIKHLEKTLAFIHNRRKRDLVILHKARDIKRALARFGEHVNHTHAILAVTFAQIFEPRFDGLHAGALGVGHYENADFALERRVGKTRSVNGFDGECGQLLVDFGALGALSVREICGFFLELVVAFG